MESSDLLSLLWLILRPSKPSGGILRSSQPLSGDESSDLLEDSSLGQALAFVCIYSAPFLKNSS
jgi:hypothetical protein